MSEPIPQPPPYPLVGHLPYIDPQNTIRSFEQLAAKYGRIFRLSIGGKDVIIVSDYEIFNELCDDHRFRKSISPPLAQVRNGVGSGLFTAFTGEHDWEVAHRVLMPAFGPIAMVDMFQEMHDICSQLIQKWSRLGSDKKVSVTDDFTRLTLDSIALCAMDMRFNSFYRDDMHPFVEAMVEFLAESGERANRPRIAQAVMRGANQRYEKNIETLKKTAREVIQHRKNSPSSKKDLLNAMVQGRDPRSGESMSDENIINNIITFLIAGHETTSGLLSFTVYYLLKYPQAYRKVQEEIDRVVGSDTVKSQHIPKLEYTQACLRESLRLQPTAPGFSREVAGDHPEVVAGGQYQIPNGVDVISLLGRIQRDPEVFGKDAESFKPERMLRKEFDRLPKNAWKPFGNGERGCIGRPFAWQEAVLALALIFQNFDLRLVNPGYELRIKQTLTMKPEGLEIYTVPRGDHGLGQLEKRLYGSAVKEKVLTLEKEKPIPLPSSKPGSKLMVLFGSNTGTCEGLAQTLASRASARGIEPSVATLDSVTSRLPTDQPIVVITASFEGAPADNANQFSEWVTGTIPLNALQGVRYAVFGCGHHDWASTYQKVPKAFDEVLAAHGATRMTDRGESDVAYGNVLDDFDSWLDEKLWPALSPPEKHQPAEEITALDVDISSSTRVSELNIAVSEAMVEDARLLSSPGVTEKRVLSFRLPTGVTYSAGDYLSVLPLNPPATINRVLKRFRLAWDTDILIKPPAHTHLPVNERKPVVQLLAYYVELGMPASKKSIVALTHLTEDEKVKSKLMDLAKDSSHHLPALDILELYPEIPCPFGIFLSLLPAMRIRQYSISSSPLVDPNLASITYAVLDTVSQGEALSRRILGVTTNYLKTLGPGEKAQIAIKKSHYSFHLPANRDQPIIMVCAGTGVAPFRAFVEERAAKIKAGWKFGQALLFIGCKNQHSDRLYAEEFDEWERVGAVQLFYAFSQEEEASHGCRYVQERIYREKELVRSLFAVGAKVFVCGSGRLGKGVKEVIRINLVFPLNNTYALVDPFPIIFSIQNAPLAYSFGFTLSWNITGTGPSAFVYTDSDTIFSNFQRQTPPDTFIIVNSTLLTGPIQLSLPAGQWSFSWTFSSGMCLPESDGIVEITHGTWGGSIDFTTVYEGGGGTSVDLTNCPIAALDVSYVGNWLWSCPQIGNATYSGATVCDSKLDAAQASSISAVLQMSTVSATASWTGSTSGTTGIGSHSSGTSSSIPPTGTNAVGRPRVEGLLLGAIAFLAGLGAMIF